MTAREKQVLTDAMRLSVKQRARLARELLASIDGEPDEGAEAAWAEEIEQRAVRALSGKSKGTEWSIVRDRLRRRAGR